MGRNTAAMKRGFNYNLPGTRMLIMVDGVERMSFRPKSTQIKPTGDASATITGLEISPRFQAGVAGENLRGLLVDPVLKAGSGNISGQIVGVECNIDFGLTGSRVITGDISAFSSFLAIPSSGNTYSGQVSFLRVRGVNIRGWDQFLNIDDANTGMTTTSDPSGSETTWLKVMIGSSQHYISMEA